MNVIKNILEVDLSKNFIRKVPGKKQWKVLGHTGRSFGTYPSQLQALKRLRQIEFFKHKK
jgi:hypothetical protein